MLFMYIHIIWVARRQRREMKALTETYSLRPQQMDAQTWALAKTVAIIVLISNLCWLPGVVVICLHLSGSLEGVGLEQRGDLITYTGLIVFSNSLLNPIIYTVKIPEVKKRFLMLLCCQKTRPSRGHSSRTNYTDDLDVIEL
ncbi:LPAR2-like protein [Mya arenaria]|uniref:LPAR2-like protein n=1 Tax=Mya arenaria TaxID=6604 RepID=A0ABY7FDC8_MYAAR|nr:LPAR2-like protein [Mya arenaria]